MCGMASIILDTMKASSKNIQKKIMVHFSPQILRLALSVYTRSKVGYEELHNSSLEVLPAPSTIACLKSKLWTTDSVCPNIYQWFYDQSVQYILEADQEARSCNVQ